MKNESLGLGRMTQEVFFFSFSIPLSVVCAMPTLTTKILLSKMLVMNSGFELCLEDFLKVKPYSLKKIFQDPG